MPPREVYSPDSPALFLQTSIPFQSFSDCNSDSIFAQDFTTIRMINNSNKRKRRPAGTPDPDAEVVSLSPETLMESDRYICEICNQGFQREQNLQMHRRRHKVPWKLLKRESPATAVRKRVFVCPEPTCLHHDPSHALGDLVGIKKHFRRKHSSTKQWICHKCCKGYAVQSDFKAHLKTCGTRGHTCDCGRVFSRVESFIEHQDSCSSTREMVGRSHLTVTNKITSTSRDTEATLPLTTDSSPTLELQLMPWRRDRSAFSDVGLFQSPKSMIPSTSYDHKDRGLTDLQLRIGLRSESSLRDSRNQDAHEDQTLKLSLDGVTYVDKIRKLAKEQQEIAELELRKAKIIREKAEADLKKAEMLKDRYVRQVLSCDECRMQFQPCNLAETQRNS